METYAQPPPMKAFLQGLLADPFNTYCVDCTKNLSTHANITYGTFICVNCANIHSVQFGQDKSYVKPIFEDLWDSYQMKLIAISGGNKVFYDFMKEYKSESAPIPIKYKSS